MEQTWYSEAEGQKICKDPKKMWMGLASQAGEVAGITSARCARLAAAEARWFYPNEFGP